MIIKKYCLLTLLAYSVTSACLDTSPIEQLAKANGYQCSRRVSRAIAIAARAYKVDAKELTAIAIIETGLGKYSINRVNANGTIDVGLFQINSVNYSKCKEYAINVPEGSALCAAKLLSNIKRTRSIDYIGIYHSKTPERKISYIHKVRKILSAGDRVERSDADTPSKKALYLRKVKKVLVAIK